MLNEILKSQLRKDLTAQRRELVRELFERRPLLRFAIAILDTHPLLPVKSWATIVVAALRAGKYRRYDSGKIHALYWTAAEKKALAKFRKFLPPEKVDDTSWSAGFSKAVYSAVFFARALRDGRLSQVYRISRRLSYKYHIVFSARALEAIFSGIYFSRTVKDVNTTFAISTESNPHGLALLGLAKHGRLRVVFISHAPLIDHPLPVHIYAGFFWGQAQLDQLLNAGATIGHSFLMPTVFPIQNSERNTILIGLSKNVNYGNLASLIQKLRNHPELKRYPVFLRRHPNSTAKIPTSLLPFLSPLPNIDGAVASARMVIAGNSTFHLEALARKRPSFLDVSIDGLSAGTLPFIENGFVKTIEDLLNSSGTPDDFYGEESYNHVRDYYYCTKADAANLAEKVASLFQ